MNPISICPELQIAIILFSRRIATNSYIFHFRSIFSNNSYLIPKRRLSASSGIEFPGNLLVFRQAEV